METSPTLRPAFLGQWLYPSRERFRQVRIGLALLATAVAVALVSSTQRSLLGGSARTFTIELWADFLAAAAWIPVGLAAFRFGRRVPITSWRTAALHAATIPFAALALNIIIAGALALAGLWPAAQPSFAGLVIDGTLRFLHINGILYLLIVTAARPSVRDSGPIGATDSAEGSPDTEMDYNRLAVRVDGALHLLPTDAIRWVEAAGDYVRVHAGGRGYLVAERLNAIEGRLDPDRFARVHRSAIVNVGAVREIRPRTAGDATLVLTDGTEVALSRRRRSALLGRIGRG